MTSFVEAVKNQSTRTTNGMKSRVSSANACVDFFYTAGAMRGKDIIPVFIAAYVEDADVALRITQWLRDVRNGAGERQLFRDILVHLEKMDPESATKLINKVPELGRFDDLFVFNSPELKAKAYSLLGDHLRTGQYAKQMLDKLDSMSEEECQRILDTYN
jgi:hypothetical protein